MTTGHYIWMVKRKIHKEDIIKAGRDIMFLKGYNATGIKDITDSIEIPKGSFYNHFLSKEEFGLEVLKAYAENGTQLYQSALLNSDLSPLERLDTMFTRIIENYKGAMNFKYGCLMGNFSVELADVNENFRLLLEKSFHDQESAIVTCLKQGQQIGEVNQSLDCNQAGSFIINSWHGALVRMKSAANAKPLEDFKICVFRFLNS